MASSCSFRCVINRLQIDVKTYNKRQINIKLQGHFEAEDNTTFLVDIYLFVCLSKKEKKTTIFLVDQRP